MEQRVKQISAQPMLIAKEDWIPQVDTFKSTKPTESAYHTFRDSWEPMGGLAYLRHRIIEFQNL
jgi:hypothetical protein